MAALAYRYTPDLFDEAPVACEMPLRSTAAERQNFSSVEA